MKVGMVKMIAVSTFLLINAWSDWKRREILLWSLWVFLVLGILLSVATLDQVHLGKAILSAVSGAAVGGVVLLLSRLSRGAVGAGDGLLLCVTGVYIGFCENLALLLGGLLLCGICAGVLLMGKLVTRKTELPFVPFLFLSFWGGLIL